MPDMCATGPGHEDHAGKAAAWWCSAAQLPSLHACLPLTGWRLWLSASQIHFVAKHPKLPWEEDKIINMHELIGATTQGLAVRGSTKKK